MPVQRRVVITGIGLVSPLGISPDRLWDALQGGVSGVRRLTSLPEASVAVRSGGEAIEFTGHIDEFGDLEPAQKKSIRKGLKVMCREIQMGVAASQLAFQHAGWTTSKLDPDRTGIVFGSDYIMTQPEEFEAAIRACLNESHEFQQSEWAEQGLSRITPLWLLKYLPNMPACHVAIYNDLRGPNNSLTVREASANLALAEAYCTIQRGHADVMMSGATGSRIHPIRTIHIQLQEELAEERGEPETLSRPFDADRTGMVVGEGAAAMVLEERSSAEQRGAKIWGEIVGFGSSAVIQSNSCADRTRAMANAMQQALRSASLTADQIDHLHAHGSGKRQADREEAAAIQQVFGQRSNPVPVVAAKSYFGNLGAAGGAVEMIASLLACADGMLFPTLNYETPDPECPVHVVRSRDVPAGKIALNVNMTPQGQASAVIVRAEA